MYIVISEFGLYICPDFEEEIDDGKCSFTIPQTDGDSPPILLQQRAIVKVGDVCYDWYDDETESGKLVNYMEFYGQILLLYLSVQIFYMIPSVIYYIDG